MAKNKKKTEYINREVSWLAFNERVLQEANDQSVPLIERIRYLGIFSNNLDEFFKVRVATLQRATKVAKKPIDPMDFDPEDTLTQIANIVLRQQQAFNKTFDDLVKELAKHNIQFVNETALNANQKAFCENFFENKVRPFLVPIMLNSKRPFPELKDNTFYLAIELGYKNKGIDSYALLEVPRNLPRFIELPSEKNKKFVIFIEDIIRYRLRKLFGIFDFDHASAYTIKITRDGELDIDDDISESVIQKMSKGVHQRKRGQYVRMSYDRELPPVFLDYILKKIKIKDRENVIPGSRYHNKRDLMRFPDFGNKNLVFPTRTPIVHPLLKGKTSLFQEIARQDIMLHLPYHSFNHIIDLLREAAIDPAVRTIRINIYRVAKDSSIVNALINAARNGKRVLVIVELAARFDEENNIKVTQALQEAGARVIPGVQGLKVHCKLIQISRREGNRTVRYAHVGTGNFNENTAGIYTDISLLTANQELAAEVRKVFDFFESNFQRSQYRHLILSPFSTRRKLNDLINEEIDLAMAGKPAWLTFKVNNLVDAAVIRKLYEASQAGVKVNLIVRGTCSLVPGIPGQSENINAVSIVGRYLEHSRIYAFGNGGKPLYFISSADLMTRNLDFRVEVTVPIIDERSKNELQDYLNLQLDSKAKARRVDKSLKNEYIKPINEKGIIDTQEAAYKYFGSKTD